MLLLVGETDGLLRKALDIISGAPDNVYGGVNKALGLLGLVQRATERADQFALFGLFPLCLTLLLLHENARSITEGSPFRISYVLGKAGIVVALLLAYSDVCRLITHIAGIGGGWMRGAQYYDLSDLDRSKEALGQAWDSSDVGSFVVIVIVWIVTMGAALF